jgi:serine/threonine protein kinase
MSSALTVSVGQYSDQGRKESNQDFHGVYIPDEPQLSSKGIAIALADGISSSAVSHVASQTAVSSFLQDYFCTAETWSVKQSAHRVLRAINSWLYAQTRQSQHRYEQDKGYVCTFSAMVIKSTTAHLFHIGDTRIYCLRAGHLQQLTEDHRLWLAQEKSYLSRAMGINQQLDIDYQAISVKVGDIFLLASDGAYEPLAAQQLLEALSSYSSDLEATAKQIVELAYAQGSTDNLTVQVLRIDTLPNQDAAERHQQLTSLPFAPPLEARMLFDGYRIIRQLHASSRSHAFLATDTLSGEQVVIKTPGTEQRNDPASLERFLLEEWIARRINSAHVLKPCAVTRQRQFQYTAMEFIDGQTLTQWMRDHPRPELNSVRSIVSQLARGLQAFHRLEMLHQDLRPENIMIDASGTVKIIDFGSTQVAGLLEMNNSQAPQEILGTEQYAAPEYFLGDNGSPRSDMFSLGVITYQLITGELPYGTRVSRARTPAAQRQLHYVSARRAERAIPAWLDEAIGKAVHPDPYQRYAELSEFIYDLHQPNQAFLRKHRPPLLERNPLAFWQVVSLLLSVALIVALNH